MTAILMAPQTIPARFSLPEDNDRPPAPSPAPPTVVERIAAAAARLRRPTAPRARAEPSSAAAW